MTVTAAMHEQMHHKTTDEQQNEARIAGEQVDPMLVREQKRRHCEECDEGEAGSASPEAAARLRLMFAMIIHRGFPLLGPYFGSRSGCHILASRSSGFALMHRRLATSACLCLLLAL